MLREIDQNHENTRSIGKEGEAMAKSYLEGQGYQILAQNLHSKFGEIDLVAQKNEFLFFIEIKRRRSSKFGAAIESVPEWKQKRIRKTAEYLLLKEPKWRNMVPFFSVVAIDESLTQERRIEFIPDAFV